MTCSRWLYSERMNGKGCGAPELSWDAAPFMRFLGADTHSRERVGGSAPSFWLTDGFARCIPGYRVYGETRVRFGLGAQLAISARARAVEAIKAIKAKGKETCPTFGPRGSIRYDARTYRLMSLDRVSLNTLAGRVVCRLVLGPRQHAMLVDPAWKIGGADLVWKLACIICM